MNINYIFEPETKQISTENDAYVIGCKISKNIVLSLLSVPIHSIEEENLKKKLVLIKSVECFKSVVNFDILFEIIGRIEKNEVKYNIFNPELAVIAFYPTLPGNCDYNNHNSKELTVNQKLLQIV